MELQIYARPKTRIGNSYYLKYIQILLECDLLRKFYDDLKLSSL